MNGSDNVGGALVQNIESVLEYFPDNPLVEPTETAWRYMLDNYTKWQISMWGNLIMHEISFFGICLPGFIFQFLPFMQKFKIQQSKPESFETQWKCFKSLMFTHFCIQMPMITGAYYFCEWFGIPYEWEQMPRWYDFLWRVLVCFVIDDTWHYWSHRIMHHKKLYPHVHKIHHHHTAPFGMTSEYAHPGETILLATGVFFGLVLFCNHFAFLWVWSVFRLLEVVDVHSGYDIPWINPLHLLPGYAGARFHDYHHCHFVGNYAPTFRWWDWICGTDVQWKEHLKNQEGKDKKLE